MTTRRKVLGAVGLLASCVLTCSRSAVAQEFHVPRFYVTNGVHASGADVPDAFLTRTVTVDLSVSAVSAARAAATDAHAGLVTTGQIPSGQLVLYLVGFGDDPAHASYPTFFVLDDDRLDGMSNTYFRDHHGWLQPDDASSAQTYLHPFLTRSAAFPRPSSST